MFFEIPQQIEKKLLSEKYHLYDEIDFEIIDEIIQNNMTIFNVKGVEELRFRSSDYPLLNGKINNRITNAKFTSREEYFKHLGFNYVDSRTIPDDEIISQLSVYSAYDSKVVHIPCSDPNHYRFANLARNKGFPSLKSFLNYYGFEYKRTRISNFKENSIEKIEKYYIVDKNKVYIHGSDPFYVSLYVYAQNRKLKINDILRDWGYERLYKEDLPENYVPYNWAESENKRYTLKNEEDYKNVLDDLIIEENLVYLDSTESFYIKLYRVALMYNLSVNELLEEWGYRRVYIHEVNETTKQKILIESDNEVEFINRTLQNVKDIQGDLSISNTEIQRRNRSKKLAIEMKKLYSYRCQICSKNIEDKSYIPPIEKVDGTFYVEVHHIIPVSKHDEVKDDSDGYIIDSYENLVVVCPHHHRVLHYHNGGYFDICTENGDLYFKAINGEYLRIHTNYHLSK